LKAVGPAFKTYIEAMLPMVGLITDNTAHVSEMAARC
jgi:hypothetical protein